MLPSICGTMSGITHPFPSLRTQQQLLPQHPVLPTTDVYLFTWLYGAGEDTLSFSHVGYQHRL